MHVRGASQYMFVVMDSYGDVVSVCPTAPLVRFGRCHVVVIVVGGIQLLWNHNIEKPEVVL